VNTVMNMQSRSDLVRRLALEFARLVRRDLTADELREAVALNYTPIYDGCCATHDFVDANMTMLEAYANVAGVSQDDVDLEAVADLWHDAWSDARLHEFDERQILGDRP
jgi:hypothetical protein